MRKLLIGLLVLGSFSSFSCESERELCKGDRVVTSHGLRAKVHSVAPDGKTAQLMFTVGSDRSTKYSWSLNKLARMRGCTSDGYCVGDKIITDHELEGTIKAVYIKSKNVMIRFKGENLFNRFDDLNAWSTSRIELISTSKNQ